MSCKDNSSEPLRVTVVRGWHEVVHAGRAARLVFILDTWHPQLPRERRGRVASLAPPASVIRNNPDAYGDDRGRRGGGGGGGGVAGLSEDHSLEAGDTCCFYMPVQWVMPCLHWAAGEKMCHLPLEAALYTAATFLAFIPLLALYWHCFLKDRLRLFRKLYHKKREAAKAGKGGGAKGKGSSDPAKLAAALRKVPR